MRGKSKRDTSSPPIICRMPQEIFERFSLFIKTELGIKLPPAKKNMLEARLQKRLRALGMGSHEQYCKYLFSPEGMREEMGNLVDVVTTNTTDFFREPKHFEILSTRILPELRTRASTRPLEIWSAGCSSGEEPYTLAMVLSEFAATNPGFRFRILGTDICREVLQRAMRGVYPEEKIESVPPLLRKKYLLRSKDRSRGLVRIDAPLRRMVEFRQLNFMSDFGFDRPRDVIFCRNVVIYFDRPTQSVLFKKFCANLAPGGYLFIGHSESLTGLDLPLRQVAPTVYLRN